MVTKPVARARAVTFLVMGLVVPIGPFYLSAYAQAPASIWDGVYTQDQADRGAGAYSEACARCHGNTGEGGLFGPGIVGSTLDQHWTNQPLAAYYAFIRDQMPPGRPGSLRDQVYVDILAHILALHGAPPGESELPPDEPALGRILIVPQSSK